MSVVHVSDLKLKPSKLGDIADEISNVNRGMRNRGGSLKSSFKSVADFFRGKKKLKPSDVLNKVATVLDYTAKYGKYVPGLNAAAPQISQALAPLVKNSSSALSKRGLALVGGALVGGKSVQTTGTKKCVVNSSDGKFIEECTTTGKYMRRKDNPKLRGPLKSIKPSKQSTPSSGLKTRTSDSSKLAKELQVWKDLEDKKAKVNKDLFEKERSLLKKVESDSTKAAKTLEDARAKDIAAEEKLRLSNLRELQANQELAKAREEAAMMKARAEKVESSSRAARDNQIRRIRRRVRGDSSSDDYDTVVVRGRPRNSIGSAMVGGCQCCGGYSAPLYYTPSGAAMVGGARRKVTNEKCAEYMDGPYYHQICKTKGRYVSGTDLPSWAGFEETDKQVNGESKKSKGAAAGPKKPAVRRPCNGWLDYCKEFQRLNPNLSWAQVLRSAKKSW